MNILYLTYDGLSDPLGQSQVLTYLSGLRKLGHEITIISSEKRTNPELITNIRKRLQATGIKWINVSYTKNPPILSTVYDVLRMYRVAAQELTTGHYDIIHCRSYITSLIGLWLKKKFGTKFVFDMRGFYADERIDGGMWNQKKIIYRLIYRFFKRKEAQFLTSADYTICLTQDARKEIHSWRSVPGQPIPIQVIPCCADSNLFTILQLPDEKKTAWKKELGVKEGEFILTYVGAVGTWYMLDEMLDFFNRLLLKYSTAKFLFITHEDPRYIQSAALHKGIPSENIIVKRANHNEVPELLSLSDLSIFFIKPVYSKKASSPAKHGEIMSMGIPIVCNSNIGDTERIIRETGTGSIVRSFSNEDYDYVIEDIPRLKKLNKENIRAAALNYFSLEIGVQKYHEVYQSLGK